MARMQIVIPGAAVGKPRMTQRDKWAKRPEVMRYRAWADLVRLHARRLPDAAKIKSLSWSAYFAPPPSWSRRRAQEAIGELHRAKPDRDNIDKAILDTLFDEDSGIAAGHIEKRWDVQARLVILIEYEE